MSYAPVSYDWMFQHFFVMMHSTKVSKYPIHISKPRNAGISVDVNAQLWSMIPTDVIKHF
jgi:hypothetical protein